MSRPLSAVVMAAGEGTRMRSTRPKPLHLLCGRPMLLYVLDALGTLDVERTVVVVGHGAERVSKKVMDLAAPDLRVEFVEQHVQRGTADALSVALTAFPDDDFDDGDLLVLPGDTPLLRPGTIEALVAGHRASDAAATLLTARVPDPVGYGRVVRGKEGRVVRVVEHRDATPDEQAIDEINTSIYCFRRSVVAPALRRISPDNHQGEYYLTDVVAVLAEAGYRVDALVADDAGETGGVNDRAQLAEAESALRSRTNQAWLRAGVTMVDPRQTYVDATVELACDVTLFPGVILQGRTVIGAGTEVGAGCHLVDTVVGEGCHLEGVIAQDAEIGAGSRVGPFVVLRPGDHIPPGARTGPFYTPEGEGGTG